jgi:hypothetical protein
MNFIVSRIFTNPKSVKSVMKVIADMGFKTIPKDIGLRGSVVEKDGAEEMPKGSAGLHN